MSITFTGLASGLPVNDIIDQLMTIERQPMDLLTKKKSSLSDSKSILDNIESRVNTLKSALQKFTDGNLVNSMDLFKKKSATSSDTSVANVTAGADAANQTFDLNVVTIATASHVESLGGASSGNVGNAVQGTTLVTDLANGSATTGTFTVFNDNQGYQITVNAGDSVNNVLAQISAQTGGLITGAINGATGKVTLTATGNITVGANNDTSSFLSAMQLDIGTPSGSSVTSANNITAIKTSGKIVGNQVNFATAVSAGTVTIGSASFTIDANTTLDSLLSSINSSSDAGVTASFNLRTNKIELMSKNPGKVAINLQEAGTNFLEATNLVSSPTDTLTYQTLGDNAEFQINNGPLIESTSNTVGSTVTGLKGVTISLLKESGGSNVSISVQQDNEQLTSQIETFVSNYNATINYIDQQTNPKTGKLPSDPALVRFRNNLRNMITNIVNNSSLTSLGSVGITTGSVGLSGDPVSTLSFDKSKFLDALNKDPEAVRAVFIGDHSGGSPITGVMENMFSYVNSSVDPTNGFFATRDKSIDTQISDLEKSIAKAQERLDAKEQLLKQQFSAMESSISKLKSQSSNLTSQTG